MPSATDIIGKMKTIKTLPHIAIRLTRMINDDTSSLQEFEEVIRVDPTLVLRLVRLVNSPYYALASKVESIAEAVAFVGMDNLRNLIVMDIFKHIVTADKESGDFSRTRLWHHCAAMGVTCQMISERIFEIKGEDAFLGGLMHDIGLIVEDQIEGTLFEKAYLACQDGNEHITVHESRIIGTDHAKVGAELAADWNLPRDVIEGIAHHHKDQGEIRPKSITGFIMIAEYLTDRMGLSPFSGLVKKLPQALLNHIYENIDEYKVIATDLPETIKKANEVFGLD